MKTFKTLGKTLCMAAALFILNSCSHDDDNAPAPYVPAANSSYVKGTVEGTAFSSLVASCSRTGSGADGFITILGGDTSANSLTVVLAGVTATGTYDVNNTTNSVLNYTPGSGGIAYSTGECSAASGTITVTAIDATHVEGTFSFVGKDTENCDTGATKTVSNGTFKGVFQN
jgi:hypothetical protein